MGRSALDEDAIRLIEQHNPDVEFDWTRILKGQDAPPEPKPSNQQERRGRPLPRAFPAPVPAPAEQHPDVPIREQSPVELPIGQSTSELPIGESTSEPVPASARLELELQVPALEPNTEVPPDESVGDTQPTTAAQARLGFEGLSRLRARHAEVLARISEKVTDTARRDQLKSEAERLNPDTWVTDAEVTNGLEAYETVFESLRGVVGRRSKRRGRSSGAPGAARQTATSDTRPDGEGGPNKPGEDM